MISILLILISLASTTWAAGSIECNFLETTGVQTCSGAAGQPLIFHLTSLSNPDFRLKKDNKYMISKVKNKNVTLDKEFVHHRGSFTDGTLRLGNAMKKHTGDYVLELFGSNGGLLKKVKVHLEIQAPVSKPVVSQMCLSPNQVNITCSSEGDDVVFCFTVNIESLPHAKDLSQSQCSPTVETSSLAGSTYKTNVSTVTIILHDQQTGDLICHVRNKVSRNETVIHLESCTDSLNFPVVTVAVIASVITALVFVALCICKRHLQSKSRPATATEGEVQLSSHVLNHPSNGEDCDEVIYTQVRVIQAKRQTEAT